MRLDDQTLIMAEIKLMLMGRATGEPRLWSGCSFTHAAAADGVIQEMEAELLRAIADTLDCPIPPFIPAQAE
jgi:hypothetical protein